MPTVTLIDGVTGEKIKAADFNANNAQLRAALNAGLDKTNFGATPDLPVTVLHGSAGASAGLVLCQDGVWRSAALTKTKYGQVDVAGTSTETALISQTITGGTLGVNGILRGTICADWLQNSGGPANWPRLKLYYGASAIIDTGTVGTVIAASATRWGLLIDFWLNNQDTAHQFATLTVRVTANATPAGATGIGIAGFNGPGAYTGIADLTTDGTKNVDSTVDQTLALKVINASSAGSYSTRMQGGLVELL